MTTVVTAKEQKGVCKVSEGDLHTPTKRTSLPSLTAAVLQLAVLLECVTQHAHAAEHTNLMS